MTDYDQAFDDLTDKQREAVEYIDGPLLVIAGPGTGKTQLLSMRVAQILKKTDASASNILCLTFTNKAAANMKTRLQKLIGSDALQVNVKTFHSLAAELMGEYPEYFWNGARLTTAPDAVQTDIINSILSRLPLDNPLALKFVGKFTSTKRVSDGLKLVKEAGLTPDKLRAIINANLEFIDQIESRLVEILSPTLSYKKLPSLHEQIAQLPDQPIDDLIAPLTSLSTIIKESLDEAIRADDLLGKTTNTGDWKRRLVQSEKGLKAMHKQRRANEWWLHLADVYEQYRQALYSRGCYDYSDMLVEVISQLESNPSMLADVQERYHYVLIDEFQDSNAAQMRLANLIVNNPVNEGRPNLMVVGDDDQSIYKFNGAELNNMLSFRRTYDAHTIVLEDNFRSSQAVLDTAKQIIELAEDRIVKREPDLSKNLTARNEPANNGILVHRRYETAEYQYLKVVQDVVNRQQSGSASIAILARQHSSLMTIASELKSRGVPISYELQNNILELDSIKIILGLAKIVQGIGAGDNEVVNSQLSQILGHPLWQLDSRSLWELAVANRYQPNWLNSLLESSEAGLKAFGDWLMWLSKRSFEVKLPVFFDYVLGLREGDNFTSPLKDYLYNLQPDKAAYVETLSAVQVLRTTIAEFANGNEVNLSDFVSYINIHEENNLSISDTSVYSTGKDAVQLMTVHKAKGLEFETVYIIDAIENQWKPSTRATTHPLNLPLQPYGDDMDDYVRLMFVAATRAKRNIIVTSFSTDSSGNDVVATPLIASALPLEEYQIEDIDEAVSALESALRWPEVAPDQARQLLANIIEDYSLNVTALMNFLNLEKGGPQYFLEQNLLRLPGKRSVSLAFGTAIHSALEDSQRQISRGEFDLDQVKASYKKALAAEPILPSEQDRYLSHGLNLLDRLFGEQLILLPEDGVAEVKLNGLDIGGAMIGGKLDHIIKDGNSILISDYKTGAPLRSFTSQDKTLQSKIWSHKTQLTFYALLAKHHPDYAGKQVTGRMLYLEAEEARNIERTYEPSTEEIERLENLCRIVYKLIAEYRLPDVSDYTPDHEGTLQFEQDLLSGKFN